MSRGIGRNARPLVALVAVLATVPGAAGCGGGDGSSENDGGETASPAIEARDFSFEPTATEVAAGTEVTWENVGEELHNVRGRGFFSGALAAGDSYEHRFVKPGRYSYLCTLHPTTMRGVVSVKPADGPTGDRG